MTQTATRADSTPAPATTSGLRPLPMRISHMQFTRLHDARARDGLSVQEHVRRALDFYLAAIEGAPAQNPAHSPPLQAVATQPPNGASPAGGPPAHYHRQPVTNPAPAPKKRRAVVRNR